MRSPARILFLSTLQVSLCLAAAAQTNTPTENTDPNFGGEDVPLPGTGRPPVVAPPVVVPPVAAPVGDPCDARIDEHDGVVTLSFKDASRAGQRSSIRLDEQNYVVRFDPSGALQARAPMLHESADLEWPGAAGAACRRHGITFTNYRSMIVGALVWKGDFVLGLHVVEPQGRVGGPYDYVSPERPNRNQQFARGSLQSFGEPGRGMTQVQRYTLPIDRNPGRGDLYFYVEFASLGNPAQAPYCGDSPQAEVSYQLIEFDLGQRSARGGGFPRVDCGKAWMAQEMESSYLQRWPRLKL